MSIWRNRTVDSDHPEPRRDVGFIIYAVILLSVICLVPIIRLLFLSLVSPSASSVLASPVAERTAFAVAVIVCVTALWGGRFQGPATLPPFLTYALAGSDIPRLLTYRRPLLIAASWVLGMLTAASILVAASMWTTDIIFALDAALVVVSGSARPPSSFVFGSRAKLFRELPLCPPLHYWWWAVVFCSSLACGRNGRPKFCPVAQERSPR